MTAGGAIHIGMEPFKSARLSSNSVRIVAPERMVVVDAGGDPELLRRHLEAIRVAQPTPPVPVCFALTHAHVDHVAGLTEYGALPEGWSCELAAHEEGVRILREADRAASLAELTGREVTPMRFGGWRSGIARREPGGSAVEPDVRIPLGGGEFLEGYCTPGHCPDHVAWRAGRVLFAGDLLAATAPLVAGISGWDRDALLGSLDRLERLMEAYGIEEVHVGHGKPLGRSEVAEALARSRREAGALDHVDPVDARRVLQTADYANGLIGELDELFGEIAARISRLADKLAQIQESRAADEVRGLDRSAEVRGLLRAFERFKREAHAQGDGALGVAAKGIQTVQRISGLLEWGRLDWVLDESFLRFARTRVVDFIQRAKGLAPSAELQLEDLAAWAEAFAARLRDSRIGACRLDGIAGGDEGFRRQLVYCLARAPSLGDAELSISAEPGPLPARMDAARFGDALTRMVEILAARGAVRMELRVAHGEAGSSLEWRADRLPWPFDEARSGIWAIIFGRAGARAQFPAAGEASRARFDFWARGVAPGSFPPVEKPMEGSIFS